MAPSPSSDVRLYRWRFGTVEFDEARHELRVAGLAVDIEHKPLQVLSVLLRHVGEVVTKEELFDQVWTGRITVDHVLATAVGKLRKALDAAGEDRITTVPRVGYRLEGPVERVAQGQRREAALTFTPGQPVPGREQFLLERPLGRTLGSEVWLARQPRTRDSRVFKFSVGGERLGAIKREATLMRVLRDTLGERDDFVRVLDWNFENEPFFLECEYGGQALPEWAEERGALQGWSRGRKLAFFLRIAAAVDAAHGVGVLHKDIKPANVLVRTRGDDAFQPCLTDFGNSRLLQPERLAELGITGMGMTVTTAIAATVPVRLCTWRRNSLPDNLPPCVATYMHWVCCCTNGWPAICDARWRQAGSATSRIRFWWRTSAAPPMVTLGSAWAAWRNWSSGCRRWSNAKRWQRTMQRRRRPRSGCSAHWSIREPGGRG
ncbi:winged helix-turn-helix domain-containing protein [Pseudoxanthomonas mexicana]|uniref:Winged helix-turn-helix domain-containing protein n=1 Tax=Pseudoxanthomonas mexicana TaxID=128785 RepID=A0ABX6R9P7_PSEMX|nr:winged helix-turn-helix domain-containing protein [Pseudoxanthomonas mexicana]QND79228.1 winged helix-turn-helix domain-containing protein [Pseudoxanthomonas mexicana]